MMPGERGYQGFCDNSIGAYIVIRVAMREEASKIIENCLTSFMDDPLCCHMEDKLQALQLMKYSVCDTFLKSHREQKSIYGKWN